MNTAVILLQIGCAFAASGAFALALGIRKNNLLWAGLGGAMAWSVYLISYSLTSSIFISNFVGGWIVLFYSEILARIKKAPVTVFLNVAFIPLVPGGDAYQTMENCILGQLDQALHTGLHMLGVAVSIVLGVFFGSMVFKIFFSIVIKRGLRDHFKSRDL